MLSVVEFRLGMRDVVLTTVCRFHFRAIQPSSRSEKPA